MWSNRDLGYVEGKNNTIITNNTMDTLNAMENLTPSSVAATERKDKNVGVAESGWVWKASKNEVLPNIYSSTQRVRERLQETYRIYGVSDGEYRRHQKRLPAPPSHKKKQLSPEGHTLWYPIEEQKDKILFNPKTQNQKSNANLYLSHPLNNIPGNSQNAFQNSNRSLSSIEETMTLKDDSLFVNEDNSRKNNVNKKNAGAFEMKYTSSVAPYYKHTTPIRVFEEDINESGRRHSIKSSTRSLKQIYSKNVHRKLVPNPSNSSKWQLSSVNPFKTNYPLYQKEKKESIKHLKNNPKELRNILRLPKMRRKSPTPRPKITNRYNSPVTKKNRRLGITQSFFSKFRSSQSCSIGAHKTSIRRPSVNSSIPKISSKNIGKKNEKSNFRKYQKQSTQLKKVSSQTTCRAQPLQIRNFSLYNSRSNSKSPERSFVTPSPKRRNVHETVGFRKLSPSPNRSVYSSARQSGRNTPVMQRNHNLLPKISQHTLPPPKTITNKFFIAKPPIVKSQFGKAKESKQISSMKNLVQPKTVKGSGTIPLLKKPPLSQIKNNSGVKPKNSFSKNKETFQTTLPILKVPKKEILQKTTKNGFGQKKEFKKVIPAPPVARQEKSVPRSSLQNKQTQSQKVFQVKPIAAKQTRLLISKQNDFNIVAPKPKIEEKKVVTVPKNNFIHKEEKKQQCPQRINKDIAKMLDMPLKNEDMKSMSIPEAKKIDKKGNLPEQKIQTVNNEKGKAVDNTEKSNKEEEKEVKKKIKQNSLTSHHNLLPISLKSSNPIKGSNKGKSEKNITICDVPASISLAPEEQKKPEPEKKSGQSLAVAASVGAVGGLALGKVTSGVNQASGVINPTAPKLDFEPSISTAETAPVVSKAKVNNAPVSSVPNVVQSNVGDPEEKKEIPKVEAPIKPPETSPAPEPNVLNTEEQVSSKPLPGVVPIKSTKSQDKKEEKKIEPDTSPISQKNIEKEEANPVPEKNKVNSESKEKKPEKKEQPKTSIPRMLISIDSIIATPIKFVPISRYDHRNHLVCQPLDSINIEKKARPHSQTALVVGQPEESFSIVPIVGTASPNAQIPQKSSTALAASNNTELPKQTNEEVPQIPEEKKGSSAIVKSPEPVTMGVQTSHECQLGEMEQYTESVPKSTKIIKNENRKEISIQTDPRCKTLTCSIDNHSAISLEGKPLPAVQTEDAFTETLQEEEKEPKNLILSTTLQPIAENMFEEDNEGGENITPYQSFPQGRQSEPTPALIGSNSKPEDAFFQESKGDDFDSFINQQKNSKWILRSMKTQNSRPNADSQFQKSSEDQSISLQSVIGEYQKKKTQYESKIKRSRISLKTIKYLNNVKRIDNEIKNLTQN